MLAQEYTFHLQNLYLQILVANSLLVMLIYSIQLSLYTEEVRRTLCLYPRLQILLELWYIWFF
jgi:hypothetical protein